MFERRKTDSGKGKSPWRYLFAVSALISGGWLALYGILQCYGASLLHSTSVGEGASIGIIGGADGPTSVFVTTRSGFPDWDVILAAAILLVSILAYLRLCRTKQK